MARMDREDLVPSAHRDERLFLLDLLCPGVVDGAAAASLNAEAFLEVTPRTLYPYVHWRLLPVADRLPGGLIAVLAQHHRQAMLSYLRRVADLRRIGAALDAGAVRYLVLKGPVLAAMVYPDAATRTMVDLDLLVHDGDMTRGMAILEEMGYEVPSRFDGVAMNAGDAPPMAHSDPGAPVVELHSLLDSVLDGDDAIHGIWSAQRTVDLGNGVVVPTLAPAEFFAHVVMHVSRHHLFEGELRSLLDVALLLGSPGPALDWEALRIEWRRRRVDGWIELTLALATLLLRAKIPDAYTGALPQSEALMLAAEQLWARKETHVAGVTSLITGEVRKPLHSHAPMPTVVLPRGLPGFRVRASRQWQRARRLFEAFREGSLRPQMVAGHVNLFRKRERLFALVENGARQATTRHGHRLQ
jgi:hypothetical protein